MVERYTLKNGIPLFIVETHASPVVSIQAWVSRGSAYESDKLAGISHFLEHALFKGTKRRKVGEIALEIESRGGEINAFTSFEETAYYTTLASRYFEDGLDVIADAVQNPLFDRDEMMREREVILEEIKRALDSPYKMVSTNLWKESFAGTPYGRPVLGFEETVRKIDDKVLRQYFDKHYHAGTLSLFVVGDIDRAKVAAITQKKFAKAKQGPKTILPKTFQFPKRNAPKVITLSRDVKECHLQLAVSAPPIVDAGIPALDLVCSAIGQGESSRLYQRLVKETRLAMEAHMGVVATSRCGMAAINLVVAPENLEKAISECMSVISNATENGLEESEIERVKSSLEAEVVGGKETVEGYARRLGYYYVQFGDPGYEKKYLDSVLSVTAEQATQAAAKAFGQAPVISMAHPLDAKVDKKRIAAALKTKATKKHKVVAARPVPEKTERKAVKYITKEEHTLPIVTLRFIFRGGSREEDKKQAGISHLFQRVWASGTKSYNSLQIAQTLESLGASLHAFAGKNTLGISVEFLSKQWPVIQPILSEVLHEPTFPEDEFSTEKELMLRDILSERDSPGQVCQLNFLSALYKDHPYGRPPIGTKESVSALTVEDMKRFYRENMDRNRLVVASVGHFHKQSWLDQLERLCVALPEGNRKTAPKIPIARSKGLELRVEKKEPLFQAHIMAGFLGASFQDSERYALKLLSSCLGGQGGRLFLELRDKQSLAYTVSPINNDGPESGVFAFYIGCSPEKTEKALTGIRTEIDKIIDKPMGAQELARAKEYWIGRFELDMQRYAAQAMLFGLDETYGFGFDHAFRVPDLIKAITAKEIQEAAQKFLTSKNATISVVHNGSIDENKVRKAWGE